MNVFEKAAAEKERKLLEILASMESAIVAFSGGVDSAYLAVVAKQALGDRSLAVTGESPSYPDHQRRMAVEVVEKFRLAHRFVPTEEIENPEYLKNHPDRCFHCKSELYTRLQAVSAEGGFRFILDGANADDRADFRPGRRAAKLMGVRSPLEEAELTKAEIRLLSEKRDLPTASEPASACLARVPYESRSIPKLDQVERVRRRSGASASVRCGCAITTRSPASSSRPTSFPARSRRKCARSSSPRSKGSGTATSPSISRDIARGA
jgi:uncharacterized protein